MNSKTVNEKLHSKTNVEKENIIQAVVVADSFNKTFAPASHCLALLPLVNKKLLDYTLEWLNIAGVNEVIIFCSSHVNEIKQHLSDKVYLSIDIKVLVSEGCYSFGDVMRALDRYAVIRNTFVLLSVDVIGNFNFVPIIEKFKTIQKNDKEISMMTLFKEIGNQRTDLGNNFIVAYNSENRIIHYHVQNSRNLELPLDVVLEQDFVEIRNDLLNPGLAICSDAVPPLFSDNFDFQTINDFIRGMFMNEEIIQSTVYCEILKGNNYVAKVTNWPMYQIVSQDIVRRWTYPIVPDISEKYSYSKNSIYLKNATFSQGCRLGSDIVIGSDTKLKKNVYVHNSIIGCNCLIGNDVIIENSFIFDNVKIDDNSVIRYSVIGHKCHVKKKCVLEKNCILGPLVTLNAESKINNIALISKTSSSSICKLTSFSDGCYVYENSDSEDEEIASLVCEQKIHENNELSSASEWGSSCSVSSSPINLLDDVNIFYNEVIDSLTRGYEDKLKCENLILEINSSRYAYNVTVNEVNYNILRAILSIQMNQEKPTMKEILQHVDSKLKYFTPILRNYIKNEEAQRDCLPAIEDVVFTSDKLKTISPKIIQFLYDKDILSEEIILSWFDDISKNDVHNVKNILIPFIKWLNEAEEESDESD
ncbi:hypothetical protein PGB90_005723 [Kerria lacca]